MTRAEAAQKLCKQLVTDIANEIPIHVGRWDKTWDIVGPADAEFMIALTVWEATGSEEDRAKVRTAYDSVLDAWMKAALHLEAERQGIG